MGSVLALLNMIEAGSFEHLLASYRRTARITLAINAVLFVLFYGYGVYTFWQAWQTGNWSSFWTVAIVAPTIVLYMLYMLPPFRGLRSYEQAEHIAQELRRVAPSADARLAPLVSPQPEREERAALLAGAASLEPLRRLPVPAPLALSVVGAIIVPPVLIAAVFEMQVDSFIFAHPVPLGLVFLPGLVVLGVLVLVCVFLFRRSFAPRHFAVSVDALGLRWNEGRETRRLPWDSVQSFFRVDYSGSASAFPRHAYIVDGGETLLLWTLAPTARTDAQEASERLSGAIVTHTGKSLLDLSSLASALVMTGGSPVRLRALGIPTDALASDDRPVTPSQDGRRRGWVRMVSQLAVPVLLLGLLYGVGGWLQRYQPEYYASLPARLHAEQPLFHDALTTDTGAWTPADQTATARERFAYANGAYQLSSTASNTTIGSWAPGSYGDAAVEVTARQTGSADNDGVGLVVRADDASASMLVFAVNNTGNWMFYEYHTVDGAARWSPIDDGQTTFASTGDGAANQLLLLMRGSSYLYYINDHLVGSFTDDFISTPHAGHAGVFVLNSATQGAFTGFSVYPVQSSSSFYYV